MSDCLSVIWAVVVGYCTVSCTMSLSRIVKLMEAQNAKR